MRTRIVAAFPGTGKTTYHNAHKDSTLDSDSSFFSWAKDEEGKNTDERNPDFPGNYIQHIKENIGKYDFIFVSSHKVVRDALKDNCLFFYLVYPEGNRKEEFIKRYKQRGNAEGFVKLLESNWDAWIRECDFEQAGCKRVSMSLPNLENELSHIIRSENGEK